MSCLFFFLSLFKKIDGAARRRQCDALSHVFHLPRASTCMFLCCARPTWALLQSCFFPFRGKQYSIVAGGFSEQDSCCHKAKNGYHSALAGFQNHSSIIFQLLSGKSAHKQNHVDTLTWLCVLTIFVLSFVLIRFADMCVDTGVAHC